MIHKEEELINIDGARVRIMILEPGKSTVWHFHSEVRDHIFCLEGIVTVSYLNPEKEICLFPGQRCDVDAYRIHQVKNTLEVVVEYLLVQGVGRYDFNPVPVLPNHQA